MAYFFWLIMSLIFAGIAGALTIYVAPKATGSGIPELMGMLNGVEIPNFFSYRVLIVKIVGVCLAVASTLCIGKEGPLAHIGACVAVLTIYLPISWMKQFQNDENKRQFIAMGISAGVSCAFGAPIGGTLLAYEISTPNTFWTFDLLWMNFCCSSIATFTLQCLFTLKSGGPLLLSDASTLKFGLLNP